MNFKGNIGAAWRWLDADLSGWISLHEVDPPSSALLHSFKDWADANFGSVRLAFQALDADGGGTLSFSELRRACRKWRWEGEVRLLFDCLDIDSDGPGRRQISVHEISFLDEWEALEPSSGDESGLDSCRFQESNVRRRALGKPQKASSQPELPALPQAKIGIQTRKFEPEKASVKQLCQTFKCPKLIKAKPASKETIPSWWDRLWLASRENRDNTKGGHPIRPPLAQVTLPDFKVLESAKAAENARIATEALKEKVQSNGLTIISATPDEECITGGYLALQFDLEHHPEHGSQQTMKVRGAPRGGLPEIL
jgi:hypothetical protein